MKKLLLLFLMLPLFGSAQFCGTATSNTSITPSATVQTTATFNSGRRAFTFSATKNCTYTFSTIGLTTVDTYLRLYSTSTGGTELTFNDDFGGTVQSQITWTCPTTGTYSILLTRYVLPVSGIANTCATLNANTSMSYVRTCDPPPPNDACSNAIAITSIPYTSAVTSTVLATTDVPTSTSSCGNQGYNLWYTVVGNNTYYTATTCDASTNFDTEIRIYTGACSAINSMTEVDCNDDDEVCGSSRSKVKWCAATGITYYISVGYFSIEGTGNFVLNVTSSGESCSSTTPIELLSFDAYMVDTTVNIKWSTATETNCDYFLVQRSIDGIDWKDIAHVNGNGTSATLLAYSTRDPTAAFGNNYYRLKEVDYNGQFEIFPIKSVYKPTKKKVVSIYIDALGQQITDVNNYSGLYLILYTDGSVEKRVKH